jgi:hypothetical protein
VCRLRFGKAGKPYFCIAQGSGTKPPLPIAFASADRPTVDAFHFAGLAAGARDNGAPGLRSHYHYHSYYYGVVVLDPDENNIEAMCHRP